MAAALAALRARDGWAAHSAWLGAWLLSLGSFAVAALLFALPLLARGGWLHGHWLRDFAPVSAPFGVLYLLLGALMLLPGRGKLRRIAAASLIGSAAAYTLFARALYPAFDMRPASRLLAQAESQGRAIGNLGLYDGQFEFMARMTRPVDRLYEGHFLQRWAVEHPRGLVIEYPDRLAPADLRSSRLVQPYRGSWMVIWDAPILAALRRGQQPPEPGTSTVLLPSSGYWRYAQVH
jgi:hypothetical protein